MIEMHQVNKFYTIDQEKFHVLKDIDLSISAGEFVAIMGPSGSGKSTLINTISFLDSDFSGDYLFEGKNVYQNSDDKISHIRNRSVGFVFQSFQLIDNYTIAENIALPLLYSGMRRRQTRQPVIEVLEKVGLADKADKLPKQLSGGQQQRAAIARALVARPKFIVADEPTGALDSHTSTDIMNLFTQLNQQDQTTILMVTHDPQAAAFCQRTVLVKDGELVEEGVADAV